MVTIFSGCLKCFSPLRWGSNPTIQQNLTVLRWAGMPTLRRFCIFSANLKTQNSSYNMPNCFSISFITWLNSACSLGVHTSPCALGLMSDDGKTFNSVSWLWCMVKNAVSRNMLFCCLSLGSLIFRPCYFVVPIFK